MFPDSASEPPGFGHHGSTPYPQPPPQRILPCPFARGRDIGIGECEMKPFGNMGKLNEHLRRAHSLKYVCRICQNHHYPVTSEKNLGILKKEHEAVCRPQGRAAATSIEAISTHARMTEEQHQRWMNWSGMDVPLVQGEPPAYLAWRKIYKAIHPDAQTYPVLGPDTVDPGGSHVDRKDQRLLLGCPPASRDLGSGPSECDWNNVKGLMESLSLSTHSRVEDLMQGFSYALVKHLDGLVSITPEFSQSDADVLLQHLAKHLAAFVGLLSRVIHGVDSRSRSDVAEVLSQELAHRCDDFLRDESMQVKAMESLPSRELLTSTAGCAVGCLASLIDMHAVDLPEIRNQGNSETQEGVGQSSQEKIHEISRQFSGWLADYNGRDQKLSSPSIQQAFDDLAEKYRSLAEHYSCNKMELISYRVFNSLVEYRAAVRRAGHISAHFHVDMDIAGFLQENYDSGLSQDLSSIICFVGQLRNANLTTIGDYFDELWPEWPRCLLEAIHKYLAHLQSGQGNSLLIELEEGRMTISQDCRVFVIGGDDDFIIAMGQQLAWLAAACRTTNHGIAYSRTDLLTYTNGSRDSKDFPLPPTFNIKVATEAPSDKEKSSCWNPLLGNSVLIAGFPMTDRPSDLIGLQSQIATLAGLVGIQQAVTYQGGYVLKGRYHALVPVERVGDTVQWHLISTSPARLTWGDIEKHCSHRIQGTLPEDCEALLSSNAVLGWCGQVENLLGTSTFPYDRIKFSDAKPLSKTSARISEATIGFSNFIRATAKVTFGRKDGVSLRERSDHYETLLDDASELNIFLYDTKGRRTVHTNGERLILQLILHAHHQKPFVVGGQQVELTGLNVGDDLRRLMMSQAQTPLIRGPVLNRPVPEGTIYFKDKVQELYGRLDKMQAHGSEKSFPSLPTETSRTICGWEYLELVANAKQMNAKQVELSQTCGSWPAFAIDPDIRGIFLFGHGFGDILCPVGDVCPLYRSLPEGLDLLGVTVADLATLLKHRGFWDDPGRVTSSGWVWHRPSLLFEPCNSQDEIKCQCDRIQAFRPPFPAKTLWLGKPKVTPPNVLEPGGAVIFGAYKRTFDKIYRKHEISAYAQTASLTVANSTSVTSQVPSEPSLNCSLLDGIASSVINASPRSSHTASESLPVSEEKRIADFALGYLQGIFPNSPTDNGSEFELSSVAGSSSVSNKDGAASYVEPRAKWPRAAGKASYQGQEDYNSVAPPSVKREAGRNAPRS